VISGCNADVVGKVVVFSIYLAAGGRYMSKPAGTAVLVPALGPIGQESRADLMRHGNP